MKTDVRFTSPQATVQAAARQMRDERLGFLPVCDDGRRVLGVLTDRDLTTRVLAEGRDGLATRVEAVMSREVVACRADDDLRRAEQLMSAHRKARIMVLNDDGRLIGVISLSDLAERETRARVADTLRQVTSREVRSGRYGEAVTARTGA